MITTAMIPFLPSLIPNMVLPIHTFIQKTVMKQLPRARNFQETIKQQKQNSVLGFSLSITLYPRPEDQNFIERLKVLNF